MKVKPWEVLMFSFFFLALGLAPQKSPEGPAPSIGISIGQKMPFFAASDQFGREVSSDTLRGPNGTVLLFFRSADW